MKTLKHILLAATVFLSALSCDKPVVDVYETTFSIEAVYVDATDSHPAGVTLRLHDGNPSLLYTVEYRIDNSATLHLSDINGEIPSPATISFTSDSTMTLYLPDLAPGDHTLTFRFVTPAGGIYDGSIPISAQRMPKALEFIDAPGSVSLTVGDSEVFGIEVGPSDADDKVLSVTSTNPLVVSAEFNLLTVGQEKQQLVLSAHTVGSADVVITDASGKLSITVPVTVSGIRITDITLSASSLRIKVGQQQSVTYTLVPEDATDRHLTASVSDTKIATATVSGHNIVVTGLSAGSTKLSVECAGYSRSITVTVYEGINESAISVTPKSVNSLAWGAQVTFKVTSPGPYTVDYDRDALELVTSNSEYFILKNVSPEYVKKDVSFTVSIDDNPSVKAVIAMYAEPKPETISVSGLSSSKGVATYTVGGDNLGWRIVAVPSGLQSSVSGNTITLKNSLYETITGTLMVQTDLQGIAASVSVSVSGKGI